MSKIRDRVSTPAELDYVTTGKIPLKPPFDSTVVKHISVNLIQSSVCSHLGATRETRGYKHPVARRLDLVSGLSKWLEGKNVIADHPLWSGESWPLEPGHWEVVKIREKEYLFPVDSILLLDGCVLEINTERSAYDISVEVQAPIGKAQGILDEIRDSIKKYGVMKGNVISGGTLLERSTATLDNFFVNSNVLEQINTHLLNLFDGKKEIAFHAAGMPFKRGVMLTGIPGTGKTTLGRIIEATNPGITTIWLDHNQLESRLSEFMELARELAPTIVFMEDIDTVATTRDIALGNTVLGKILNEMDGREINEGIVFVASSNRPEDLDPALIRPGRFDITIELELPNIQTRRALLSKLLKKLSFPLSLTIEEILPFTKDCTQADIEELVRSAVLSVLYEGKKKLQARHFQTIIENKRKVGFTS